MIVAGLPVPGGLSMLIACTPPITVFLRILEYYSGILFLTTNRVGTLDEAFKSRIHISLYYPPLDRRQTLDIFEVNIRKLQEIVLQKDKLEAELRALHDSTDNSDPALRQPFFINRERILHYAGWHYDINQDTPQQRWNGRQIRNAFQIAYSLARFDIHSSKDCVPGPGNIEESVFHDSAGGGGGQLDSYHFELVAGAMEKFEDYLYHTINGTDGDQARKEYIRDDDYDHRGISQKPVYTPLRARPERRRPVQRQHQYSAAMTPRSTPPHPSTAPRPKYQPLSTSRDGQPPTTPARNTRPAPERLTQGGLPPSRRTPGVPGGGGGPPGMGNVVSPGYMKTRQAPDSQPRQQQQQQQQHLPSRGVGNKNGNRPPVRARGQHSDSGYSGRSADVAPTPQVSEPDMSQGWDVDGGGVEAGDAGYFDDGEGEDDFYEGDEYYDDGDDGQPEYDYLDDRGKAREKY